MKKKIVLLTVVFALFICLIFLYNNESYAGSQKLYDLQYVVDLNEDGSAEITEIWDISIYDTNTLFKTFELDDSKYGEITDVSVLDITSTEQVKKLTRTDTYAYHVQKDYYYALELSSNEFEIAWGVSVSSSAHRKYKISYKITDAVKTYDDCSEFYWMFISTSNGIPADKVTGTIKLPKAVQNKESIKVWAHGPLNGEIYAIDNQTVSFSVNYLDIQTMVEARVAVTENIFSTNNNVIKSDKLQSIIKEETSWADTANKERDRLRAEAEKQKIIARIIGIVIILIAIIVLILFIRTIIKYLRELKKINTTEPETKYEYFRDFPDADASPAEAAFLYYFDKERLFSNNISKIVSGIIMNLALKKIIEFEEEKGKINIILKENKMLDLNKDESVIYDLLKKVMEYKNKKEKENTNKISMKDIAKYAKNNDRTFLGKVNSIEEYARNIQGAKNNYNAEIKKITEKWKNKANTYFVVSFMCICFAAFVIPLFVIIPCIICGIICNKISKKYRLLMLTQKGVNEQEEWKGLKRYMENFSLLNEREVPELVLWEKYLVYATAFGIADKVLKQLKVKYPELNDENYMLNNGYTYMYMMNRYNFDRILNSGMHNAYSAGMAAKAAREAASSSYSSGGGRRRRLFFRRRRSVVAGGRNGRKIILRSKIFEF